MPPDENEEERLQKLPGDNQTPYQPADPTSADPAGDDQNTSSSLSQMDDTHPQSDTNFDSTAAYHAGTDAGMGLGNAPSATNAVVDYDPANDQRRNPDEENKEDPQESA